MTAILPIVQPAQIFYPSSDGEPLAETSIHVDAIVATVIPLRLYLAGRQALVLTNQFLYYAQGFPKLRIAPDVMVIFDVVPGARDNYKVWEEGQVPAVIFEMTSKGTQEQDKSFKKTLYEQMGVQEYWLFDPKGEWIEEQLQGYRLRGDYYEPITDSRSEPLKLRLAVEGNLLGFYREDTGEKLLIPDELAEALREETQARKLAEEVANRERQQRELAQQQMGEMEIMLARYRERFGELPD